MPFGTKPDLRSGEDIHFDEIYERGIRPAIEAAGLESVRGDQETAGGIIHTAMFARLLLAEFVIADLTTANPNVFYELGVRHTAKPYTTIPIFATVGAIPFDVALVRAVPYDLVDGTLTEGGAKRLREALAARIDAALHGPVSEDSPLFQLFEDYPGIEMSHEITDAFRDRADYCDAFRAKIDVAKQRGVEGLHDVEADLGDVAAAERGVLMDLFLAYRDVDDGFPEMIRLFDLFPAGLRESVVPRQQLALALNRRNGPGDVAHATRLLTALLEETGGSAETYGILGRIHKDVYRAAKERGDDMVAMGSLDLAIEAYTRGFEIEPADFYPGVNAVTLLIQKGTPEALAEADRLVPLVTFAAVRRGGAEANDYWTAATVLELAVIGRDDALAMKVLPRVVTLESKPWMLTTTADNLELVRSLREATEPTDVVVRSITELRSRAGQGSTAPS
jgi:hypothetical protein